MKVIALGTGTSQGVPMIGCQCDVCTSIDVRDKRLRSSVYIESEEAKVLIDIGPDFRRQFLDNKLDSIDLVLVTHEHNDHIIGLDDIRSINFIQNKAIPLYAEERVATQLRDRFAYAFNSSILGLPKVDLRHVEGHIQYKDLNIIPVRVMHGNLPIYAYRINNFSYITDASKIEEDSMELLKGSKIIIINALRIKKHPTHYNLEECLEVIKALEPERAYITHISHSMGKTENWSVTLPDNVYPLIDGLHIEI